MQQEQINTMESPAQAIIRQAGLNKPQDKAARAWARMTTITRLQLLRAARCPEANAYWAWENINANTRRCIQTTADMLAPVLGGLKNAAH